MAKLTLVFAVLLGILGLTGYLYTGSQHPTALIPLWWGIALAICGYLAITPNPRRRSIFMHIAVALGALGFIGALVKAITGYGAARSAGLPPDHIAIAAQLIMAGLLLIYVNFCVRSFIQARRAREQ